uniref:Uncharacterized protein n=1 Tax=Trichogramma kaykai TaxID=54128 RepID=A0ABD2W6I9_9HYME
MTRAEEIKRKRTKDTSFCSIYSSSDDDMGEKPSVRQAKLRAKDKIFKIIQDGKRPLKKLEQTTHEQTVEVSNTIPPHSHEPEASTRAQHNEQETPAEESADGCLTTPTKTHTSEPTRAAIEVIDLCEAQSLEWDANLNGRKDLTIINNGDSPSTRPGTLPTLGVQFQAHLRKLKADQALRPDMPVEKKLKKRYMST